MKILMLCGYFDNLIEKELFEKQKGAIQFAANIFQSKLIDGFSQFGEDFTALSTPFIGSYPNASSIIKFKGKRQTGQIKYVGFNNIWGIRNFSRAKNLKKNLKDFIACKDSKKIIVVYSAHTPFLQAAYYAKKKDKNIQIFMIVPDLPQYMNLSAKKSFLYRIGKKFDLKKINKLNNFVDKYVFLTEQMKEIIDTHNKPYSVVEGIVSRDDIKKSLENLKNLDVKENDGKKYILYAGTLNKKFGVKNLVDAFMQIENPNYVLVICGAGEMKEYILTASQKDNRIMFLGQVKTEIAKDWMLKADVLVNPRPNDEEYTKYSFPSKTIEYLLSGNIVVGYILDGMKDVYNELILPIKGNTCEDIADAINSAMAISKEEKSARFEKVIEYFSNNLENYIVTERLING